MPHSHPGSALFAGANRNLVVYADKGMKNQKFDYDINAQTWTNRYSLKVIQLGAPAGNAVISHHAEKGNLEQLWRIDRCHEFDKDDENEEESEESKESGGG